MRSNKGITLTSLVIYITVMFVVLVALMRIVSHFRDNISDVAETSFETEFQKINLYLLDESKRKGNTIDKGDTIDLDSFSLTEITEMEFTEIEFADGNRYTYNGSAKAIYLNDNIELCKQVEECSFRIVAQNGKMVLKMTIKIYDKEREVEYVITGVNESPIEIAEQEYIVNKMENINLNGYQKLEYIESTGTQYMDTGFIPNQDTKVEVKFNASINKGLYSSDNGSDLDTNFTAFINQDIGGYWRFGDTNCLTYISYNEIHTTIQDKGGVTVDNNHYNYEKVPKSFTSTQSLKLGYNTVGFEGKIYYFKLWDDDILVRNMIPCYRKVDNVVGMYDSVNRVFYANEGEGEFVLGPEI